MIMIGSPVINPELYMNEQMNEDNGNSNILCMKQTKKNQNAHAQ